MTIAVIDTNVDAGISELSGQLAPGGRDIRSADRVAGDIDSRGHGSMVSSAIVARKDGQGVHGIAYDARVLAIRADRPGSCQQTGEGGGCRFSDADVIAAIDYAVAQGVRVINLSLGGPIDSDPSLENALRRAASAGVLIVVAAGNEATPATGSEPAKGLTPTEPAHIAGEAASLGRIVAVGSVDPSRRLSAFSNRAGLTQTHYILAPGEKVVLAGVDDDIRRPDLPSCSPGQSTDCNDTDSEGDYWLASGTSFAAPLVSGALALMLQKFPNITPENALRAILETADDYVDAAPDAVSGLPAGVGRDAVSGVGIMNLARAFSPIGGSAMSFATQQAALGAVLQPPSGAFGDWASASGGFDGLVFQDALMRGFRLADVRLGAGADLYGDLLTRERYLAGAGGAVRVGAARLAWYQPLPQRPDPRQPWADEADAVVEAAVSVGSLSFSAGRGGAPAPGSLAAVATATDPWLAGSAGETWLRAEGGDGALSFAATAQRSRANEAVGVDIGADADGWRLGLGVSDQREHAQALGGSVQSRFGLADSSHVTLAGVGAERRLGPWDIGLAARAGRVALPGVSAKDIRVFAWSAYVAGDVGGGRLSAALRQPLRAESGSVSFFAPTLLSASGAIRHDLREASLSPSGRQVEMEVSWRGGLQAGWSAQVSGTLVSEPHHVAAAAAQASVWLQLKNTW
jgi:hypothetical protein